MADDAPRGVGLVGRHREEELRQRCRVFIPAATHGEGELPEQKCKYQWRRLPLPAKRKAALAKFRHGGGRPAVRRNKRGDQRALETQFELRAQLWGLNFVQQPETAT